MLSCSFCSSFSCCLFNNSQRLFEVFAPAWSKLLFYSFSYIFYYTGDWLANIEFICDYFCTRKITPDHISERYAFIHDDIFDYIYISLDSIGAVSFYSSICINLYFVFFLYPTYVQTRQKSQLPRELAFVFWWNFKAACRTRTGCIIKLTPSYNNEYLTYRI